MFFSINVHLDKSEGIKEKEKEVSHARGREREREKLKAVMELPVIKAT